MGTTWEGSFHLPRHYKCLRSHPWPASSGYGHLDAVTRHNTTCHGRQLRRPQQCWHAFPDASAVHFISAHRAEKSISQAERAKTTPHDWCGLCIQACRAAEFAVRATPYGARPVDLSDRPPDPSVQAPQAPQKGWVRALKESDYQPWNVQVFHFWSGFCALGPRMVQGWMDHSSSRMNFQVFSAGTGRGFRACVCPRERPGPSANLKTCGDRWREGGHAAHVHPALSAGKIPSASSLQSLDTHALLAAQHGLFSLVLVCVSIRSRTLLVFDFL